MRPGRHAMTIVVAEDQPTSALIVRRELERLGHEVVVAPDGEAAWAAISDGDARLLVTDWMMPRLDGPGLIRRIRGAGLDRYVYILLLTARGGRDDRLDGLRAGADDFLAKPLDPDELAIRLEIAARILAVHEELARKNAALAALAVTDGLTGLPNRRALDAALTRECARAGRSGEPWSLILLDVDHFKRYNDDFGHPAGDAVLRDVAEAIRVATREADVPARYGGEEFAVLLPGTDAASALQVADRLRALISTCRRPRRGVTASLGVATIGPGATADAATLVRRADEALYRAKRAGRDRVVHHDGPDGAGLGPHSPALSAWGDREGQGATP